MIDDILRPGEYAGLKQIAGILDREERTLRRWYKEDQRIGRQPIAGGRIELSLPATLMYRVGDVRALDLYAAGARDHESVRHYIEAAHAALTR